MLGNLSLSVLVSHDGEIIVFIGCGLCSELDASVLLWLALLLVGTRFSSLALWDGRLVHNAKVVVLLAASVLLFIVCSSGKVQLSSESWLLSWSPFLLGFSWASWLRTQVDKFALSTVGSGLVGKFWWIAGLLLLELAFIIDVIKTFLEVIVAKLTAISSSWLSPAKGWL